MNSLTNQTTTYGEFLKILGQELEHKNLNSKRLKRLLEESKCPYLINKIKSLTANKNSL